MHKGTSRDSIKRIELGISNIQKQWMKIKNYLLPRLDIAISTSSFWGFDCIIKVITPLTIPTVHQEENF